MAVVTRRAIGVFHNRSDVEQALRELGNSGIVMDRVSVIARDKDDNGEIAGTPVTEKVGDKADEGATVGAVSGGALGGLTGLLVGLGTLAIPGIGPIMLAGAAATALATTIAGGAIGAAAGSLIGGLIGLGIPEERARYYNERVERGGYLVIVDGTDEEIARAEPILRRWNIEDFNVYDRPRSEYDVPGTPVGAVVGDVPHTPVVTHGDVRANRRAIGVFAHRRDAEAALTDLRDAGFPMSRVSLIAKNTDGDRIAGVNTGVDRNIGTGNKADEGAKAGAATGAALGGLGGLLVGLGALAIPGVGPVIAGGAAATALATAVTGGAIGAAAGGITGGLVGLGIPENRARVYSDRFQRGDYIVIVDGTESEIHQAEAILKRHRIEEFGVFDATDLDRVHHHDRPIGGVHTGGVHTGDVRANRRAIGVFAHRRDAEAALTDLRDAGFPLSRVSLIAKNTDGDRIAGVNTGDVHTGIDRNVGRGNKADEGAKAGAATGAALGGLGGLLVGLGALAIPGVGPVIAGGAAATALATAVTGGAIGAAAGGITGGLVGLGIPENRARVYSDRFQRGDYIVIVDGTESEIHQAQAILKRHGIAEFGVFDATDLDRVHHHDRNVVDTSRINHPAELGRDEPAVVIVDRRDETV